MQTYSITYSYNRHLSENRTRNDNLEQQAQAIYKSWFIDFEPFKGGKFVDSELGKIPEGWRVCYLSQITDNIRQKVESNKYKVLSPITKGELVLSDDHFTKQVYSEDISKYIIVPPYCLAYNPARVNIGSIGLNKFDFIGCVSPVYVVVRIEVGYGHFFDCFIKSNTFKEEVKIRAIGGVRQTLSYDDFGLIKIVYPPKPVIFEFNRLYDSIMVKHNQNLAINAKLSQIRDTLLPKLMSGELKISNLHS
jgi:type I restriction enzyme S subunit